MKIKNLFYKTICNFSIVISNFSVWLSMHINENRRNPWRCEECGSLNIRQRVWVDSNTERVTDWENGGISDCWCEECEGHTGQREESELIRSIEKWWSETGFKAMERITGYRQLDFCQKDGFQRFVYACNGWWNRKTTQEKITIYYEQR